MSAEDEIFLQAFDLPPDARADFLDQACQGDPRLRARIECLLAADVAADSFLAEPPLHRAPLPVDEQPGDVIDRFVLVRRLGEGGCGVVWLAEQTRPVRRSVALKIIKLGMDTAEVIARFEAERQALALMDHADIARVFDAGATATGRPYFVMEYVDGVPITTYCDEHQLTLPQRLALFARVCGAIQHAHQKGIIHRDVKPSNVLVAHGAGPDPAAPKVIDFGIAKATEARLTDRTLVTQLGQFMGTPAYMSPEQAQLTPGDIDTRTDVYSLGVLLYELLAGRPPFDAKELLQVGVDAMRQRIREVDPQRPSTRLQTLSSAELLDTARRRVLEPPKLVHRIAGDLDWIVMRCLEKDRARRYATAAGLAEDIARHLRNEPIEARPAGAGYRLAKLARRNRLAVAAAAAVALALIAGTIVSTWQAVRAGRAEEAARAAAQAATAEAAVAKAVSQFLLQDLLPLADTNVQAESFDEPDPDLKVRAALDRAAAMVGARFADQPRTEAAVRVILGQSYIGLGLPAAAAPHLERAAALWEQQLGANAAETWTARAALGTAWRDAGKLAEAEALFRDLRAVMAAAGATNAQVLDATADLALVVELRGDYDAAAAMHREVLAGREQLEGPDTEKSLVARSNLGAACLHQGKMAEADEIFGRLLEDRRRVSGPNHPGTFEALNNKALSAGKLGRTDEALALQTEAYELAQRVLGPEHPKTIVAMLNLGSAELNLGRPADAAAIMQPALDIAVRTMGPQHQITLTLMNNLAATYSRLNRFEDVLRIRRDMQPAMEAAFGPDHPNTMITLGELGHVQSDLGHYLDAAPLLQQAFERIRAKLGPDHPQTLAVMGNYAQNLTRQGRFAEALPLWQDRWERAARVHGPSHPRALDSATQVARHLERLDRWAEAAPVWQEVWTNRARLNPGDWATFDAEAGLGAALLELGRATEAEPRLVESYTGLVAHREQGAEAATARIRATLDRLVHLYETTGQTAEAATWRDRRAAESGP